MTIRLHLAHLDDLDQLLAFEYGRVDEGQPEDWWRFVGDCVGYLRADGVGAEVGFKVWDYAHLDVDAPELREIWGEPVFDVPMLGLLGASAGEIILGSRAFFAGYPSIAHQFFIRATESSGEEAVAAWQCCLEAGESAAHWGLGTALLRLGRYREAYRHLRYYTHVAPELTFTWCAYARAADALGLADEAEHAARRAVALEDSGGQDSGARELLERLVAARPRRARWRRRR